MRSSMNGSFKISRVRSLRIRQRDERRSSTTPELVRVSGHYCRKPKSLDGFLGSGEDVGKNTASPPRR